MAVVYVLGAVTLNRDVLIVANGGGAIVLYVASLILLDDSSQVFLGVNVNLFTALSILKADFVEVCRTAALAGAGLDPALRLADRQLIRGHLLGVVDTPRDDRLVRVALQEPHDDLLADAGDH